MPVKQFKLGLEIPPRFGGRQVGAGRPRGINPKVLHRARDEFSPKHPLHVTFKVMKGLPSLRKARFHRAFVQALGTACARPGFRLVHYSLQDNHVHMIVEADSKAALGNAMKSLIPRFVRAVHRVFGLAGKVMFGRYHMRALKTPKEVRNALAYVLLNARKHFLQKSGRRPPVRIDALSSGGLFQGWRTESIPTSRGSATLYPAPANTWLLTKGWRKHRLIDPAEVPGCL
jgi:putative transposase